jgi:hypothetical protein
MCMIGTYHKGGCMINAAFGSCYTYCYQTINAATETVTFVINLIHNIAIGTLIQFFCSLPLFHFHHNIAAIGLASAFIFPDKVLEVVERVNTIYRSQKTILERALLVGGVSFLFYRTRPASLIIATLYYSAQWTARFYQDSFERYKKQQLESQAQH